MTRSCYSFMFRSVQITMKDKDVVKKLITSVFLNNNFLWDSQRVLIMLIQSCVFLNYSCIWMPPRKSGVTPKITKARVVHYAIIQSPQWVLELTHSCSKTSICFGKFYKYFETFTNIHIHHYNYDFPYAYLFSI